jgi:hypothetical protein
LIEGQKQRAGGLIDGQKQRGGLVEEGQKQRDGDGDVAGSSMREVNNILDSETDRWSSEESSSSDYVPDSDSEESEEYESPTGRREMRKYSDLQGLKHHREDVLENDPFIYEGSSDSDYVPNSDDSEEFEKQETGKRLDMEENITHCDGAREMQKDDSKDDAEVETGMTESRSNEIVVMTTNNGIARKWDKKHYCFSHSQSYQDIYKPVTLTNPTSVDLYKKKTKQLDRNCCANYET